MRRGCGVSGNVPTPRTKLGSWGEQLAGRFLLDNGYQIVTTNYRCSYGEVDIVALDGEELVFVEVRTRRAGNFGTPEESLSKPKLRRLLATCHNYLHQSGMEDASWRVDLVSVSIDKGGDQGGDRLTPRINHVRHIVEQ